ncbi:pantoate--beta-alanine ligase [bacterium]|nr:pantoate--beta-alanine ligase [bacterium]
MKQADTPTSLKDLVAHWHWLGHKVAIVPTMGALHSGHMGLVEAAKKQATKVVVSIFVNPTQFGPNEDFSSYPRTLESDTQLCRKHGVDAIYTPAVEAMYPEGASTRVQVEGLKTHWCGAFRPGHFDGVATIVAKLLLQTGPDMAFFGEKDFQQLAIIRRMVRDLDIPVSIQGVPTLREADGLALSSRNRYLSKEERAAAPALYKELQALRDAIHKGGKIADKQEQASKKLIKAGFAKVDYIGLADAESLEPLTAWKPGQPARLLAAAWMGKARLIDNIAV